VADLRLHEFIDTLRQACDRSDAVTSYDIRVQDNATVKIRVLLVADAFIDVYYNPETGRCSFVLVRKGRRIYGADNAFIGWHVHPLENPEQHIRTREVSFADFLAVVEEWIQRETQYQQHRYKSQHSLRSGTS